MENITLEQIDLIMQRTHATYSEAKEALEHCNGDIVEALLYLEKASKIKTTKTNSSTDSFATFVNKLNATTFIMRKKDHVYVDVPLSVALIIIILTCHVSLAGLLISLIMGIRIDIHGENDLAQKINSTIGDFKK